MLRRNWASSGRSSRWGDSGSSLIGEGIETRAVYSPTQVWLFYSNDQSASAAATAATAALLLPERGRCAVQARAADGDRHPAAPHARGAHAPGKERQVVITAGLTGCVATRADLFMLLVVCRPSIYRCTDRSSRKPSETVLLAQVLVPPSCICICPRAYYFKAKMKK